MTAIENAPKLFIEIPFEDEGEITTSCDERVSIHLNKHAKAKSKVNMKMDWGEDVLVVQKKVNGIACCIIL